MDELKLVGAAVLGLLLHLSPYIIVGVIWWIISRYILHRKTRWWEYLIVTVVLWFLLIEGLVVMAMIDSWRRGG
jgi:TRAP-type C4-dicarboxylate transport system permease small subunit